MAVQITKLVKYVPRERGDDFEMTETEIVDIADNQEGLGDDDSFAEEGSVAPSASASVEPSGDDPRF
jgi:hypothetical protein